MPVSLALAVALVLAASAAVGLIALALSQLGAVNLASVRPTTTEVLEIVKIALAVVAGVGGVVALVVAYRKQRISEAGESREQAKLFNERFATAAGRLGDDSPAVRLASVHALAALADDWEGGRQMCVDVLCACLRMPSAPEPDAVADPAAHTSWRGMREVRLTIWRLIAAHLKADASIPWHGADLDFTGVTIDHTVNFAGAVFPSGVVRFSGAKFLGGLIRFDQAEFSGGSVLFGGAEFSGGGVYFYSARFCGGMVGFDRARFSGGTVGFGGAEFSAGVVGFGGAEFSGGAVEFGGAKFCGGTVRFDAVADWSHPPADLPANAPGLVLPPSPAAPLPDPGPLSGADTGPP